MIFFLTQKWMIPKQPGASRELSFTFLWMSSLCSFLCILAVLSIQFLQFASLSSFIKKDFHLSFPSSERNVSMWEKHKKEWEQELHSPILKEFSYARESGLLFRNTRKIPIELQVIPNSYFSTFSFSFTQGHFDSSLPSIVISEEMAFQLQAHIEDILEFSFLKKDQDAPITVKLLVTGILKNMTGDDLYLAFTPLSYFKDFFRSQLKTGILLKNMHDAPAWRHLSYNKTKIPMSEIFSRHYNLLFSFTWEKILLYFVLTTLLIISCIIMYISFTIVFQAYQPQWALLNVLGMGQYTIILVFALKTFFLVCIGFSLGLILSLFLFLSYFTWLHLPWGLFFSQIMEWRSLLLMFWAQIVLCGVAIILPIYRHYHSSLLKELHNHD